MTKHWLVLILLFLGVGNLSAQDEANENPYLRSDVRLRTGRVLRAEVSTTRPVDREFPVYRGKYERIDRQVKIDGVQTVDAIKDPAIAALTIQADPERTLNIYDYQLVDGVKRYRAISLVENEGVKQFSEKHMVGKEFKTSPYSVYTLYFIVDKPTNAQNPTYTMAWMLDSSRQEKTALPFTNLEARRPTTIPYLMKNRNLYQQIRDAKLKPVLKVTFNMPGMRSVTSEEGVNIGNLSAEAKTVRERASRGCLDLRTPGAYATFDAGKVRYGKKGMGYTVSLWVKFPKDVSVESYLWSHGTDFSPHSLTMKVDDGKLIVAACGDGETMTPQNALRAEVRAYDCDEWHMVTLSVNSKNEAALYLDDKCVATGKGGASINVDVRPLLLGIDMTYQASKSWKSMIDNFSIFDSSLSEIDVKKLFLTR